MKTAKLKIKSGLRARLWKTKPVRAGMARVRAKVKLILLSFSSGA
jgi:hypothetical protein